MKNRKPKYKFLASVKGENFKLDNVPCEMYIPDYIVEDVLLVFRPFQETRARIAWPFELSMAGEVKGPSNNTIAIVNSKKMYFTFGTTENSGTLVAESIVHVRPVDLTISIPLGKRNESEAKAKVCEMIEGAFYLTPSSILSPGQTIERSYTGDVKVENIITSSFVFPNGDSLKFDYHYKHVEDEERNGTLTFSELVAKFEYKWGNHTRIGFEQIDDFLMFTSFADRQRCSCLGWETYTDNQLVEFYRGDVVPPKYDCDRSRNAVLIEGNEFEEFVGIAYSKFLESSNKELLREAIHGAIDADSTIESNFLRLYSALETIVYIFRIDNDLEYALDEKTWSDLRKSIEKTIKYCVPDDKLSRKRIYDKLPELNRISFSEAYDSFCKNYCVELDDLWPVLSRQNGASLSDIRNRLVHGNKYSPSQQRALVIAGMHLRWSLERMILRVMGWSIERSNISPERLTGHTESYSEWKEHRRSLGVEGSN